MCRHGPPDLLHIEYSNWQSALLRLMLTLMTKKPHRLKMSACTSDPTAPCLIVADGLHANGRRERLTTPALAPHSSKRA